MKPRLRILLAALIVCGAFFVWNNQSTKRNSGLALIADYEHPSKGTIPVYLVNRSGEDISLSSQDGDVYLKLEYQDFAEHHE